VGGGTEKEGERDNVEKKVSNKTVVIHLHIIAK
jgi:hypothetical protein